MPSRKEAKINQEKVNVYDKIIDPIRGCHLKGQTSTGSRKENLGLTKHLKILQGNKQVYKSKY